MVIIAEGKAISRFSYLHRRLLDATMRTADMINANEPIHFARPTFSMLIGRDLARSVIRIMMDQK